MNQRTGETVFDALIRAAGPRERMKGLLGTEGLPASSALVLEPARQVHTFGMRYPIDVLFCDQSLRVIDVRRSVPPNRLTPLRWRARLVIECAAGSSAGVDVGDTLEIQRTER